MNKIKMLVAISTIAIVLILCLNIIISTVFDGPFTGIELLDNLDIDNAISYITQKYHYFQLNFHPIGYSTDSSDIPNEHIFLLWYESALPLYITIGNDAYALFLFHINEHDECDQCQYYIGSPRAIDSQIRKYAYSFFSTEE